MDALGRLLSIHPFRYLIVSGNYAGIDRTAILIDGPSLLGEFMLQDLLRNQESNFAQSWCRNRIQGNNWMSPEEWALNGMAEST